MNVHPFESREQAVDYLNWDRFNEQLPEIDLSETDRQRTRDAIAYFRGLFGEDFLVDAFASGSSFISLFLNRVPGAKLEFVFLAESLKLLEGVENFDELVAQIRDHRANGAIPVLQTAARVLRCGFQVSLEPTVHVNTPRGVREKKPDIRLSNPETGELIFVEVSRLRKGDDQKKSNRAFLAIWQLVHSVMDMVPGAFDDITNIKFMPIYVRILRVLEEDELQNVLRQIRELAQEVLTTGEHRKREIDAMVEVAISPSHDHSYAKEWAEARNMKNFVESPVLLLDEVHRAQGKIFDKMRQLPGDKPGIVVITTDENLLFPFYPLDEIIEGVVEKTSRYPRVFAVALTYSSLSDKEVPLVARIGEHIYARHSSEALCTHQTLIIRNPACMHSVSQSTQLRLQRAFWENGIGVSNQ
jgi:hypothetical protein